MTLPAPTPPACSPALSPSAQALLGDYAVSGAGLLVVNPSDGERLATVRAYGPDDLADLIVRVDRAGPAWARRTAQDRAHVLRAWRDAILAATEALAEIITLESGKPLAEARAEVAYGAAFVECFAEEGKRAYGEVIPSHHPDKRIVTLRQPVGTCAAITPWNFPIAMITRKVAPALAAGCSIVVKPAEATPLTALALEGLALAAGLPPDLFRVAPVLDPAMAGQLFCRHPLIRKLSFTGSTRVGKILMAQAAEQVTRLSLELGGNAPFLVFDDADLDAAVDGVIASKFRNAGQTCVCANRILVQTTVHEAFVEKLAVRVAALKMGDGRAPDVAIGPLIDGQAALRVSDLVRRAVSAGARAVVGGAPPVGAFLAPTVLTEVTADMEVVQSEIFGPVAPVIRFRDEAEAIQIANSTPYGLAAYVYARDMGRIWRVMERLDFGMVGVNDGAISTEVAPFGGMKQSGFGREGSRHGLKEYLEIKYCLLSGLGQ
jgi:succinate-semialdehyde dehydrogenase/glutarate-semialdehyde dehydrogenase